MNKILDEISCYIQIGIDEGYLKPSAINAIHTIRQHITNQQEEINNYRKAWKHHYNLANSLQDKLDKIREVVDENMFKEDYAHTASKIKQILGDEEK